MDSTTSDKLEGLQTPYLILDSEKILSNYKRVKQNLRSGKVSICFSVKANSNANVLKLLSEAGSCFDVASWGEINLLKGLGVEPDRITFSAPTKIPHEIKKAYDYGVRLFAFDSEMELEKLSELAPRSKVFLRLAVPNTGSDWPLERKFGAPSLHAINLFEYAKKLKLIPYGITFHVGSQCHNKRTWRVALRRASNVWKKAQSQGINLELLNMGGGFPVHYTRDVPSLEDICKIINKNLDRYFDQKIKLFVEPGRFMVGEAGTLVASVINKVKRGRENWLYLDTGVYNGLQEILEGWRYKIETNADGRRTKKFTIAGPTCDSTDVIVKHTVLPDLELGEKLFIRSTGAYTNSYEKYNGFDYPKVHLK